MSTLQLFVAVCQHRNGDVLEELHVDSLGKLPEEAEQPTKILKSFSAVRMPRNEVRFCATALWAI